MRSPLLLIALCLGPRTLSAQVTVVAPGAAPQSTATRESDAYYGPPRVVDLASLGSSESLLRAHVITEGQVHPLRPGQFWTLRDGGVTVLLIPGRNFDFTQLDDLGGARIEVRGIVRQIRPKDYIKGIDVDLLEDPILPRLPPPASELPNVTITVFEMRDRTSPERVRRAEGSGLIRRILEEPATYSGKLARVYGQFRGRNLFGDLPADSARGKDDWVLKDGDTAIWVVGLSPRGDGWKLDLDYKGDVRKWLEVEGKPEVVKGVVYLKASGVSMAQAPGRPKLDPSR